MRDEQAAEPRYPQPVRMRPGETRYWCACGHSDAAPFCTDQRCAPGERVPYTAGKEEIVLFCGCGATSRPPHCDGAHVGLKKRTPWWQRWRRGSG